MPILALAKYLEAKPSAAKDLKAYCASKYMHWDMQGR